MQEGKSMLSVEELAEFLNCSQGLIHKLKNQGKLPFIKIGTSIRFDKAEVLSTLKADTKEVFLQGA